MELASRDGDSFARTSDGTTDGCGCMFAGTRPVLIKPLSR